MNKRQQVIFTSLLMLSVITDSLRGYCDLFNERIGWEYTELYHLLVSVSFFFYVATITYITFIYCTLNLGAMLLYNFMQGCWLMMAAIDVKQEYYNENITYDATEISMMMFSIGLTIIISAYQWSKRKTNLA